MATEILSSHFNNILHYIEDNWDETDSTYHVYTLVSYYFYYLDSDLWKLFKTIKFDSEFLHVDLEYNEEDLNGDTSYSGKSECFEKRTIVYNILDSILKDNAYMPIEEEEPLIDMGTDEFADDEDEYE